MQVLSAIAVKQAACRDKPYKITDGGGLYVLVKAKGKYWRYNYRFAGKRKTLALGVYPDISLAEARKRHQKAREQLADGIDPIDAKKITSSAGVIDTFELIGEEWFSLYMLEKSKKHRDRARGMLNNDLYPIFGKRSIDQIKTTDALSS